MRNHGRNDDYDDDSYWDGVDRRNNERRYSNGGGNNRYNDMPPPQMMPPPGYWQYPPQMMPPPQQVLSPMQSAPVQNTEASKNLANSSLTLQQIGGIVIILGSIAVSLFSAWSNLNREIDSQKNILEQFKQQIAKDVVILEKSIQELKTINASTHEDDKAKIENLDKRIQDLDSTVSQIYQKVSSKP